MDLDMVTTRQVTYHPRLGLWRLGSRCRLVGRCRSNRISRRWTTVHGATDAFLLAVTPRIESVIAVTPGVLVAPAILQIT